MKGSFTGAHADRAGLVASANGGTLFLDEVGDMPPPMQVKLLRFLQEGTYTPVGARDMRRADVRVICAAHRDLESKNDDAPRPAIEKARALCAAAQFSCAFRGIVHAQLLFRGPHMKKRLSLTFLCLVVSSSAQAALNRVWVSGKGTDTAGCGALTAPCRQIAYVLTNNIATPGGEIYVLDPAGFAPFTITTSISIVNDNVGSATIQQTASGQDAIAINAGSNDFIYIRGFSLDGFKTARYGISFTSGGRLEIKDCVIRRFSNGVYIAPNATTSFWISNTVVNDNLANAGVWVQPNSGGTPILVKGTMERVTASNNNLGIYIAGAGTTAADVRVTIKDSEISRNVNSGVFAHGADGGGPMTEVTLTNVVSAFNGSYGLDAQTNSKMRLGGMVITDNYTAAFSTFGGRYYSFGDNEIDGNGSDNFAAIFATLPKH